MEIEILGRIPSKKNSKQIFRNKGKSFITSSENYKVWQKVNFIKLKGLEKIKGKCKIKIEFQFGDKRKSDLTNKAESIMDLLVDCGIIEDDNYNFIPSLCLEYTGYVKGEFKATILITKL